jgi:hypothetical protein
MLQKIQASSYTIPASNQTVKDSNYVRHPWIKTIEIAPNLVVFL